MDGLIVIDKPVGPTSHDVVVRMRRLLHEQRIGHTGTLDPAASGVLPLVIGRATRLARFLSTDTKSYDAAIRLGAATDTYDAEGEVVGARYSGAWPAHEAIERALEGFRGTVLQQPPAFSARRVGGRRSYLLARAKAAGRTRRLACPENAVCAPPPAPVTVFHLELAGVDNDGLVRLRVECSSGYYVRSLAHDLGQRLGVGAHLEALRRTRSGAFGLVDALSLETAECDPAAARAALVPLARMLPGLASVVLTREGARSVRCGRDIGAGDVTSELPTGPRRVRLIDAQGELLGIAEPSRTPGVLHPSVVLV